MSIPRDGTVMESSLAVVGPPWRLVTDPRPYLARQGVEKSTCAGHLALAAFCPHTGRLVRATSTSQVELLATQLAHDGDGEAYILQGVIRTKGGGYVWPIVKDRVELWKANDPISRRGFAKIIEDLLNGLLGDATPAERAGARRGLAAIASRPWPTMSPRQVDRALGALGTIISGVPEGRVRDAMVRQLERTTVNVAERSRELATGTGQPGTSWTVQQTETARRSGRDSMTFVTNEYGRRADQFDDMARRVIEDGIRNGDGQEAIAARLAQTFDGQISGRSQHYYRVVASAASSRARSYGQALSYKDAGYSHYVWVTVLDERTCEICRFLHGQRFEVGPQIQRFEDAARMDDPEEAVKLFPWYRIDREGNIYSQPRGGERGEPIARVVESAMGRVDERGTFETLREPGYREISEMPPAHGLCRCSTEPDI